jgi:hypothetical protein
MQPGTTVDQRLMVGRAEEHDSCKFVALSRQFLPLMSLFKYSNALT